MMSNFVNPATCNLVPVLLFYCKSKHHNFSVLLRQCWVKSRHQRQHIALLLQLYKRAVVPAPLMLTAAFKDLHSHKSDRQSGRKYGRLQNLNLSTRGQYAALLISVHSKQNINLVYVSLLQYSTFL